MRRFVTFIGKKIEPKTILYKYSRQSFLNIRDQNRKTIESLRLLLIHRDPGGRVAGGREGFDGEAGVAAIRFPAVFFFMDDPRHARFILMQKMQTNIAKSFREAEEFDIKFWRRAGANARFSAAWLMIKDLYKMRGRRGRLPGLRRTLQIIKRP